MLQGSNGDEPCRARPWPSLIARLHYLHTGNYIIFISHQLAGGKATVLCADVQCKCKTMCWLKLVHGSWFMADEV
jgi:hypothetical protein